MFIYEFARCYIISDDRVDNVHVANPDELDAFLQRVSIACYAEHCISYSKSVRLSVRQTLARVQTTQATIMRSSLENSPITLVNFGAKIQREHRERGRRMREG